LAGYVHVAVHRHAYSAANVLPCHDAKPGWLAHDEAVNQGLPVLPRQLGNEAAQPIGSIVRLPMWVGQLHRVPRSTLPCCAGVDAWVHEPSYLQQHQTGMGLGRDQGEAFNRSIINQMGEQGGGSGGARDLPSRWGQLTVSAAQQVLHPSAARRWLNLNKEGAGSLPGYWALMLAGMAFGAALRPPVRQRQQPGQALDDEGNRASGRGYGLAAAPGQNVELAEGREQHAERRMWHRTWLPQASLMRNDCVQHRVAAGAGRTACIEQGGERGTARARRRPGPRTCHLQQHALLQQGGAQSSMLGLRSEAIGGLKRCADRGGLLGGLVTPTSRHCVGLGGACQEVARRCAAWRHACLLQQPQPQPPQLCQEECSGRRGADVRLDAARPPWAYLLAPLAYPLAAWTTVLLLLAAAGWGWQVRAAG
jgi:hypothetical protein